MNFWGSKRVDCYNTNRLVVVILGITQEFSATFSSIKAFSDYIKLLSKKKTVWHRSRNFHEGRKTQKQTSNSKVNYAWLAFKLPHVINLGALIEMEIAYQNSVTAGHSFYFICSIVRFRVKKGSLFIDQL